MFQKKINNPNFESRNFINSHSMINIKPNFNKKKVDFYVNKNFKVNPNVEEIPTFSYENDLNVKSFRSFMNRQNEILKKNYENFMKYMKKHENEKRKKQLISPYSLYVKKINEVKKYEKQFLPKIRQREIQNLKMKINRNENQNDFNNSNFSSFSLANKNRFVKKEPDIKPYNRKINSFKIGNSSLAPNVILRPDDCYGNFKNISSMNYNNDDS